MHKLSDDTETVLVSVKMPLAMRDALDRTVVDEGHENRSAAARAAIEKGLGTNGKPKRRRRSVGACSGPGTHPATRRIGNGCGDCGEENAWA